MVSNLFGKFQIFGFTILSPAGSNTNAFKHHGESISQHVVVHNLTRSLCSFKSRLFPMFTVSVWDVKDEIPLKLHVFIFVTAVCLHECVSLFWRSSICALDSFQNTLSVKLNKLIGYCRSGRK